jgi:hypothetical protein
MALVDRVKNIIMQPAAEWPVIAMEPATPASLYTGYIVPLAAIPAVCSAVSSLILIHNPLIALAAAVLSYVLQLAFVFVGAFVAQALAPSFGGATDRLTTLKLIGYGLTPSWVAGIFLLIPFLGSLVALVGGLYALYVIFLGIEPLVRTPADKKVGYAVVLLLIMIVIQIIVSVVVGSVVAALVIANAAATGALH